MKRSDLAYKIYQNSGLGEEWDIDRKLLSEYLFDESKAGITFVNYEEIGCAVVKSDKDIASITLIAVEKGSQGKGVGKKILEEVERECRKLGVNKLYVGYKVGSYLWPGAPYESDTHKFFRSQGFGSREDPNAWDLVLDLADFEVDEEIYKNISDKGYTMGFLRPENSEELLKFEKENFSFWYDRYRKMVEKGKIERVLGVKDSEGQLVGATGVTWGDYKFQNMFDGIVGYGSMLGVRESERGKGIGKALKVKGTEILKDNGVEIVVVQYTTVPDFYKNLGFKEWKKYHMLEKSL